MAEAENCLGQFQEKTIDLGDQVFNNQLGDWSFQFPYNDFPAWAHYARANQLASFDRSGSPFPVGP